ncbi:MAG: H-NS histone family protein [Nevskiaceae bacterium]|nr:MAG: H-NS histone family protein [Nevskiaceae bacterium]TAM33354.1 MAG: H-NS histone family protein [Nevskiaceae bacterium]
MNELEKLSLEELLSLQQRVATEIDSRRSAEKAKAQQEILALASRYGLAVQFAGGSAATKAAKPKSSGTVAPKYRHPQDASLTWTGRGRSPVWVAEWKTKHGSLDGITIK